MIELPDLPFTKDALEPHISKQTMEYHYGKHHKGYVDNLNNLIKDTSYENSKLEDIVKHSSGPIFNNAAQVWNHTFFWNCLTSDSKEDDIDDSLRQAINNQFETIDKMKKQFKDVGTKLFGSGWCWLIADETNIVSIRTFKDADTPLRHGLTPLLVCDLWEHSYYLDWKNDRGGYIDSFWNLVDWETVSNRY